MVPVASEAIPPPPYRIRIVSKDGSLAGTDNTSPNGDLAPNKKARKTSRSSSASSGSTSTTQSSVSPSMVVEAIHYSPPNPGPYPTDQPNLNKVRFTPTQVEAIRSGINPVSSCAADTF